MDTLFVMDVAIIVCFMVLANLSRRIGEALRIPKFYTVFYGTSALLISVSFIDAVFESVPYIAEAAMILRGVAVIISIPIAVRYWHWLFNEKLQK